MEKPKKISEVVISIFEDGRCVVKNNIIHKIEGVGTIKEIVPKSELIQFLSEVVPAITLNRILIDIDPEATIPSIVY